MGPVAGQDTVQPPRVQLRPQACTSHIIWQNGAPWTLFCPPHLMPKFSV